MIKKWVPEAFARELLAMADDWDNEWPEDNGDGQLRQLWRFGWHTFDGFTQAHVLREFAGRADLFSSPDQARDNLPEFYNSDKGRWFTPFDSETVSTGYTYDPIEVGWLAAIQRRFRETALAAAGVTV